MSARQDNKMEALKLLQQSIDKGFRDIQWLKQDKALSSLQTDLSYQTLIVTFQQRIDREENELLIAK